MRLLSLLNARDESARALRKFACDDFLLKSLAEHFHEELTISEGVERVPEIFKLLVLLEVETGLQVARVDQLVEALSVSLVLEHREALHDFVNGFLRRG